MSLARYGKDGSYMGDIRIDKDTDTVFSFIKDNESKIFIMFGLNLNEVYAQKFVDEENSEYFELKMVDEPDSFMLSTESTCYVGINKKLNKIEKKEIVNMCKELGDTCTIKNIKLVGMENVKKGLELYDRYSEMFDKWNNTVEELRKDWKKFTKNGTKIKKPYLMTKEEQAERERLNKLCWSIEPISYNDSAYSKFIEFYKIIKQKIEIAKNLDTLNSKGVMEIEIPNRFTVPMISEG